MNLGAPPKSILIVRLSAIGDVIMASALIPTLRQTYPETRLIWLTEEANAGLLRHNPRLDKVIVWPRGRWRQLRRQGHYRQWLGEAWSLLRELRGERFDWVLDLQGLLKSGVWAWLAGGKTRIGLGSREGSQLLMSRVVDRHSTSTRIGKEYLKLAHELGLQPASFAMDIVASEQERMEADALLQSAGVMGGMNNPLPLGESRVRDELAVIAPFTTRPQKHWFDERWAELADRLQQEHGFRVVMLGGPADRAHAEAIAARSPGLVDLTGRTSLGQCAAIVAKADLLIGVDTGLTHLGIAMQTPTLALFGSTRPYLDPGVDYARVLYEPLPCSPCRRRPTCNGEFSCMRAHSPESVLAAVMALPRKAWGCKRHPLTEGKS